MNIHVGLGDILMTRLIIQNLRKNNYDNEFELYISKNLIKKYGRTTIYSNDEEAYEIILKFVRYFFDHLNTSINYGEHTDYDYVQFMNVFQNKLNLPLTIYKYIENYNIALPKKYITINPKVFGLFFKNWKSNSEKFIKYLNTLDIDVIILGDKTLIQDNTYDAVNKLYSDKLTYVIYDDLLQLNNKIDYTFTKSMDMTDIDILKRNTYILNNSLLNITFSITSPTIFSIIACDNTVIYVDTISDWGIWINMIDGKNLHINFVFDSFMSKIKELLQ
jgi:hypothetical protein